MLSSTRSFLQAECESPVRFWFRPALLILEVNSDDTPQSPEDHVWLSKERVDAVEVHPRTEAVVRYLKDFKRLGLEVNSDRLFPYSRAGWFAEVSKWVKERLAEIGHVIETVTQYRNGIESYILNATSDSGSKFYMKAVPPRAFNDEVMVSCVLAEKMPRSFPKALFVDRKRGRMIMSDYGPTLSEKEFSMKRNPDLVKKVLLEWARVQRESIPIVEKLSNSGVPVYDANGYKERVKQMLDDPEYLDAQWEKMTER